jgi:hypothetical protein
MIEPPQIDSRDSRDLARQLHELLPRYAPEWSRNAEEWQLADAMVQVMARYGEILIERMNRAPEKNFLAFLQTLGVSNLRPRPARVPLTFYLAQGSIGSAIVPRGTQVAAQLLPGEKDPVVFETDEELEVVSSRLTSLFAKDGACDLYSDLSSMLPQLPPKPGSPTLSMTDGRPVFGGDTPIPHGLYLGLTVLPPSLPIDRAVFSFTVVPGLAVAQRKLAWELYLLPPVKKAATTPTSDSPEPMTLLKQLDALKPLGPSTDTTQGLSTSGEVIFEAIAADSQTAGLTPPVQQPLLFWLVGRLLTPIATDGACAASPGLRQEDLPLVAAVNAALEIQRSSIAIRQAFFNGAKVDLTKDFFPFGERPKFGDTLYLESPELFSSENTAITLQVEIANPQDGKGASPVAPVVAHEIKLEWEFWDGNEWSHIGSSPEETSAVRVRVLASNRKTAQQPFLDSTGAFTQTGDVAFQFARPPARIAVNGAAGSWIRVRIVSGNYGQEMHRETELIGGSVIAANFAPPLIHSIRASYQYREELTPHSFFLNNDFRYQLLALPLASRVRPFQAVVPEEASPALYFGFEPPPPVARGATLSENAAVLPSRSLSIYLDVEQTSHGISTALPDSSEQSVVWDYWSTSGWTKLAVRDETEGLRQPGLIRLLIPEDCDTAFRFGCSRYWLRATAASAEHPSLIRLALLNTGMATGATTVRNEMLGVSNGMPDQSFRLLHTPVLEGQMLHVLEPRLPGRQERHVLEQSQDAIQDAIPDAIETSSDGAVWIPWREVPDFYASGARDRHYVLDPLTGAITFGDGATGMAPPRGAKIRASHYMAGGGTVGNRPAWNLSQLKTAVPSIAAVCNWIPAGAGGDAEDNRALLERGSRGVRHGGRAVTAQDYEDLARLASPQVARAKCVPLRDLAADPSGKCRKLGVVSVVVVAESDDPRPVPGTQLLTSVLNYLRACSPATACVVAVPPEFVQVDVRADIVLSRPDRAAEIQLAVKTKLLSFLHPLYGGANRTGWGFGRLPHRSDLFQVIEGVCGVDYVRDVRRFALAEREDVEQSDHFLLTPGEITIQCTLGSATPADRVGA